MKKLVEHTNHEALIEYADNIQNCTDPTTLTIGNVECAAITREAAEFKGKVEKSDTELTAAAQLLSKSVDGHLSAWKSKKADAQRDIDTKKAALEASGVKLDMVFINGLSADEASLAKSLIQNYPEHLQCLAIRRVKSWMDAMNSQAVAEAMVCSKSLARRRLRLSQASVRSTTQRRGRTSKPPDRVRGRPLATSDRLMISTVHLPMRRSASRSLSPA